MPFRTLTNFAEDGLLRRVYDLSKVSKRRLQQLKPSYLPFAAC